MPKTSPSERQFARFVSSCRRGLIKGVEGGMPTKQYCVVVGDQRPVVQGSANACDDWNDGDWPLLPMSCYLCCVIWCRMRGCFMYMDGFRRIVKRYLVGSHFTVQTVNRDDRVWL
jgi:hypothetical protein